MQIVHDHTVCWFLERPLFITRRLSAEMMMRLQSPQWLLEHNSYCIKQVASGQAVDAADGSLVDDGYAGARRAYVQAPYACRRLQHLFQACTTRLHLPNLNNVTPINFIMISRNFRYSQDFCTPHHAYATT